MKKEILTNHFLIAMPNLTDPTFHKSVVYVYEHGEEGAVGIVINKPLSVRLGKLLKHLGIKPSSPAVSKQPVLMGGPVGQENGFILYQEDPATTDRVIGISASKEMLEEIANGQGPAQYLISLGYAGWGPMQLETEITNNDWLVSPATPQLLFEVPIRERWEKAAELIGVNINTLSGHTGHA